MINSDYSFLGKEVAVSVIPDIPENKIASIDGYGNIKTTIFLKGVRFKPGQKLLIKINGRLHQATFLDGVFNIT